MSEEIIENGIMTAARIMGNILADSLIKTGNEELTLPQFRVLDLASGGTNSPAEIAKLLGVSPAAISETIDRLDRKGYASRLAHSEDRRGVEIVLNPKGQKVEKKVLRLFSSYSRSTSLAVCQGRLGRKTGWNCEGRRCSCSFFTRDPASASAAKVSDVMHIPPLTIQPQETVQSAIYKMSAGDTRFSLVTTEREILGIVTQIDLLKAARRKDS